MLTIGGIITLYSLYNCDNYSCQAINKNNKMATMWYQRFVETSYVLDLCNFEQHLLLPALIPTWIISTSGII